MKSETGFNFNELLNNQWIYYVGIAVVVVLIIAAVITGFGILSFLFLLFLMALSIYFGSLKYLSYSAVLTVMLKYSGEEVKLLIAPFYAGNALTTFLENVNHLSYLNMFLAVFTILYTLNAITSSIGIFRVNTDNRVNTEAKKKEDKPSE